MSSTTASIDVKDILKLMQQQADTDAVSITAGEFRRRFQAPVDRARALNDGVKTMIDAFNERYQGWRDQQAAIVVGPIHELVKAIRRYRRRQRFALLRTELAKLGKVITVKKHWWRRGVQETVFNPQERMLAIRKFLDRERVLTDTRSIAESIIYSRTHSDGYSRCYRYSSCASEDSSSIIDFNGLPSHLEFDLLGFHWILDEMEKVSDYVDANANAFDAPRELLYRIAKALEVAKTLSEGTVLHFPIAAMESFLCLEERVCKSFIRGLEWMKDAAFTLTSEPLDFPVGVQELIDAVPALQAT